MSKAEVVDSITPQEVQAVSNAKQRAVLANTEARLAESEAKNLILQIYNKYGLRAGQDQILETGKIIRKVDVDALAKAVEAEQAKPSTKKTTRKTKEANNGAEVVELPTETITD